MNKYIIYIISFILICIPYQTFWNNCEKNCKIKNAPAPWLLDYIRDSKIILSNIESQIWDTKNINTVSANIDLIRIYNYNIFNWWGYFSSFEYNVTLPLSSEIPPEIRRDYQLLQNAVDQQHNFLYRLAKKWATQTDVTNICKWVKWCELPNSWTAWDMAAQVIANTNKVISIYRLSVTWNKTSNIETFFWEGFNSKITNYYNKQMVANCSKCEWEYGDRIQQAMKNIVENTSWWNEWVQKWIDGWKLATWEKSLSQQQRKDNLRKELKRQWIWWNTRDIVLKNLEKYENGGTFIDNNFLVNSFVNIRNINQDDTDEFDESIDGNYTKKWQTTVSVLDFESTRFDVDRTQEIHTIVGTLYESLKPFAWPQDNSSNISLARAINMHKQLTSILKNSINQETIQQSEEACDRQHTWEWKCTNY